MCVLMHSVRLARGNSAVCIGGFVHVKRWMAVIIIILIIIIRTHCSWGLTHNLLISITLPPSLFLPLSISSLLCPYDEERVNEGCFKYLILKGSSLKWASNWTSPFHLCPPPYLSLFSSPLFWQTIATNLPCNCDELEMHKRPLTNDWQRPGWSWLTRGTLWWLGSAGPVATWNHPGYWNL